MDRLEVLTRAEECSLYEIKGDSPASVRRFVASTPQTRRICNDPLVFGVQYTLHLKTACAEIFRSMKTIDAFRMEEHETTVLHILRGGLNFGIRDALYDAFGWNRHSSAFISAQRARSSDNPEDWYITENLYNKVYLPKTASVVFGDVVASGTSLFYALKQLFSLVEAQHVELRSICFITIGGRRSEEILSEVDRMCREQFKSYDSSVVVYLEGRFDVATPESKLSIKYTGTDLLRSNSLLADEFVQSQYEKPSYPLERCTIYDAGSRAFWLSEYMEDVEDYWTKTLALAKNGMTYTQLLSERFPELEAGRFGEVDLEHVCTEQVLACKKALS